MNYKHGMTHTRTYRIWCGMKSRCTNQKEVAYPLYGGRGITVCDVWLESFEAFLADMGECPAHLTIERKDNDRGYSPDNCVWATRAEQNRNKRTARLMTANGVTRSLTEWSEVTGIKPTTIHQRLRYGWSEAEAVSAPHYAQVSRGAERGVKFGAQA